MILDATTFELVLTPEAALGIVQKEIQRRGWRKFEVEDVRLVYTPFYVFSFDVSAEGQQPSGKAAINACTGEVDEFVPQLLDRPLKKTKQTDAKSPKAEVEPTNVSRKEVEAVAPAKIASAVGLKKESVTVSAIAKHYIPFYRVWATVPAETGESYKINVDALMGAPLGIEAIHGKEKGWEEAGEETFEKMKSPRGFMELTGEAVSSIAKGGPGGLLQTPVGRWAALLVVIVVLAFFVFGPPRVGAECRPDGKFLGEKQYFNLFGEPVLKPGRTARGEFFVQGACFFSNNDRAEQTSCVRVSLREDGNPTSFLNTTCVINLQPGGKTEKDFRLTWPGRSQARYSLEYEKIA